MGTVLRWANLPSRAGSLLSAPADPPHPTAAAVGDRSVIGSSTFDATTDTTGETQATGEATGDGQWVIGPPGAIRSGAADIPFTAAVAVATHPHRQVRAYVPVLPGRPAPSGERPIATARNRPVTWAARTTYTRVTTGARSHADMGTRRRRRITPRPETSRTRTRPAHREARTHGRPQRHPRRVRSHSPGPRAIAPTTPTAPTAPQRLSHRGRYAETASRPASERAPGTALEPAPRSDPASAPEPSAASTSASASSRRARAT